MDRVGAHVVVLGAGMAGLLAARVLSEAYERVTVVERDTLPATGEHRKGVPQDRHVHGILSRGEELLDGLFPGLTGQLTAAGAPVCQLFGEARFVPSGHLLARSPTGLSLLQASRPFLEGHVRDRVRGLANVDMAEGCDIGGLATTGPSSRITGVRLLRRARGSAEEVVHSDLVVDATGRAGRAAGWLKALGCQRPEEESLHIGVGYASTVLRLPVGSLGVDKALLLGPVPGRPRGMALSAIEGDRWMLTLFGYGDNRPPGDPDGFWSFAAGVAPPDVGEALHDAETLEGIAIHRFESNLRRRYERLRQFPEGMVVIGDALASLNPLYGQGMTLAALEAAALRHCLGSGEGDLAPRFFRATAKVVDPAWKMATGGDLALPEIIGHRPLDVRLANAYIRRLLEVAEHDGAVATAFMRVNGMLDPLPSLLRPAVALRVLRGRIFPPAAHPG